MTKLNLIFIFITLFLGCKKYPEDHKLSSQTAEGRLKRLWILQQCSLDDIDVTAKKEVQVLKGDLNNTIDSIVYDLQGATLEFTYFEVKVTGQKNREKQYTSVLAVTNYYYKLKYGVAATSAWKFEEKKHKLFFHTLSEGAYSDGIYSLKFLKIEVLYNPTNELWTIKKLTHDELILETINSSNQKVRVKFKKAL